MQRESNLSFLYGIMLASIVSILFVSVSAFGEVRRAPESIDLSDVFDSNLTYEVWAAGTEPELVTYIEVEYTWGTQTLGPLSVEDLTSHSYFKQIDSILMDPDFNDMHSYEVQEDPQWLLIQSFDDAFEAYEWALEVEAAFDLQTKVVTRTRIIEHQDLRFASAKRLRDAKPHDYSPGLSNRVTEQGASLQHSGLKD